MKVNQVARIGSKNSLNSAIVKNSNNFFSASKINSLAKDTFSPSFNVSFKSNNQNELDSSEYKLETDWEWDKGSTSYHRFAQSGLNFYKKDDNELKEIAKELCLYPDSDIRNFSKVWKHVIVRWEKKDLSEKSYERLMPFVSQEREKVQEHLKTINEYAEQKANGNDSQELEQGYSLAQQELSQLKALGKQALSKYTTVTSLDFDDVEKRQD